jgi:hypothetical protein
MIDRKKKKRELLKMDKKDKRVRTNLKLEPRVRNN